MNDNFYNLELRHNRGQGGSIRHFQFLCTAHLNSLFILLCKILHAARAPLECYSGVQKGPYLPSSFNVKKNRDAYWFTRER
jgi:hypothetical protein